MMIFRLPLWLVVLGLLINTTQFTTPLRADLVVFGSDSGNSSELADLVNKNADVRTAIAAFERGDVAECERMLGMALKGEKNLPSVDVMIARLLMQKGRFNEALSRLETYLMKGNQDAEAHATMGEIALMSGRFTDAWLQFREALSILKTSSTLSKSRKESFTNQLLQRRAETALRRQDLVTAQTLYKELEAAMPESGFPLVAQARILIANADITRGAEMLRRAKKLDKDVPQPELQIALALAAGKDGKETEKWFRDGIKLTETATIANWFEYLKWLLTQDRPEDVLFLIPKAPKDYQSDRLLRFLGGIANRYIGKVDEAEKTFSILLSEDPGDMESANQLALILVDSIDQGKKIRAQQLSQNNLRRAPNEESVIATAAWIEHVLGATDVAEQYFNTLISRGTSNPQTIYYLAKMLDARGRRDEAKNLYKNAVELPGLFVQRIEMKEKLGLNQEKKAEEKKTAPATDIVTPPPQPLTPPSTKKSETTPTPGTGAGDKGKKAESTPPTAKGAK
jgi:tetratricopeptide (TPR) repeat protein